MQRERRRDPYPWTWEPWALAAICMLMGAVLGIQIGRALANLLTGHGWTWPAGDTGPGPHSPFGAAFFSSLGGVLGGDAKAGLAHPAPAHVAGPHTLWVFLILTELLILGGVVWAMLYVYLRWGPGRMRGMATPAEAEKLLGLTRLRKSAPFVRPDHYLQRGWWIFKHTVRRAATDDEIVYREASTTRETGEHPGTPLGHGLSPWLLERNPSRKPR